MTSFGLVSEEDLYETAREQKADLQPLDGVALQVWESAPFVNSNESLEIHVAVFEGTVPLANREPVLALTMPKGEAQNYHFPPTNTSGQSSLQLPPISAPNGTLIAYEVCLDILNGKSRCIGENYLIWNTD